MFEKFQTPALFVGKNGVLSSFASGKSTSLVVECGAGYTSISPVIDGYIIQKSIISSPFAGNALTNELMKFIEREKKVEIRPRYMIASKKEIRPGFGEFEVELKSPTPITTASFRQFAVSQIVTDIKENVCRLSENRFDEASNANIPGFSYELPDGQSIDLGVDRFKIPELLFSATTPSSISIPQMILTSVAKCDADTRRELYNSIVLTGGTTLLSNFSERLLKELQPRVPQVYFASLYLINRCIK